jgi:hypothetical protein
MLKLYKTTVVVWSTYDPTEFELSDLARDAEQGGSYCSSFISVLLQDAESDPDWDGTEFFAPDEESNAAPDATGVVAAAPELLEALKLLLEVNEGLENESEWMSWRVKAARKAIAKAEAK